MLAKQIHLFTGLKFLSFVTFQQEKGPMNELAHFFPNKLWNWFQ